MKNTLFSQSVIEEYFHKIDTATSLQQLHDFFSSSKEWLDWLKFHKKIEYDSYNKSKKMLIQHIEKRSEMLRIMSTAKSAIPFWRYFLIGFFILVCIILLFNTSMWFDRFVFHADLPQNPSSGKMVLPFRGILKDADGIAIDTKKDVYFAIYNTPYEGSVLYSGFCVGENGIVPEYNGVFTVTLGTDCGMKPIPEEIFDNNASLYLGVRIDEAEEIAPRYKISTSGYSQDTALLGGLPPGTINTSIPFIDERGSIVIDAESPRIQSTSGIFSLEGQTLSLQTSENTPGNILFQPGIGGNTVVTSGNLGLGDLTPKTRLSVVGIEPYSAIATLKNLATVDEPETSVLNLALATSTDGSNATYVNFYSHATNDELGDLVGSIRLNNNAVVYKTSAADIAEYFQVYEQGPFLPGTVMTISGKGIHRGVAGEPVVGVVTNSAGYVGNMTSKEDHVLIGLVGQIKVFVSTVYGVIHTGDRVGTSNMKGYAAKMIDDSGIVGHALEDMDTQSKAFSNNRCPQESRNMRDDSGNRISCGKILILLE
ncbi:MAG: hypothetical protein US54_C0019G0004 [Candidatus Roizmanbacteria bacterium GW2011_GWA2_37_7]|uniref:Peptidase G2 IMC autoproteolytic cleavage domain-containing protein n=1 Tax=Candidatus Roizmanbacteria bacterium GW2011_GWA2_37_7 TaxID=1618481 RepID=A0A0G0HHN6_9BACT|nr:MAG: hypothetical protein US54_C0019G0004 [Candidatus Roizmanbacteria bacterium GW2011_GWA2_37_7]